MIPAPPLIIQNRGRFDPKQNHRLPFCNDGPVKPLIYICPMTGRRVQAMAPKDLIGPNTTHIPLFCPLCNRMHLVALDELISPENRDTDE